MSIVVYMIVLLYELYFYPSCSTVRNKPLRKAVAENLRILNQLVFYFYFFILLVVYIVYELCDSLNYDLCFNGILVSLWI